MGHMIKEIEKIIVVMHREYCLLIRLKIDSFCVIVIIVGLKDFRTWKFSTKYIVPTIYQLNELGIKLIETIKVYL